MDGYGLARAVFGEHRLFPKFKEEVIAYLAASAITPVQRRKVYRAWCVSTFTKIRPEDLARVTPSEDRRVRQLGLLR